MYFDALLEFSKSDPFAQQLGLSMSTKVLICKKIEDEPAYYPDRYELLQISRPCKNSHCFQKVVQLFNTIRYYFPIRDSKRLECAKKCILKKRNSTAFELTNVYYINLISIIRAVDKGGRAGGQEGTSPPAPPFPEAKYFFSTLNRKTLNFRKIFKCE